MPQLHYLCAMNKMKECGRRIWIAVKRWLGSLSFRTGVYVGVLCVVCYILSFAQIALPLSTPVKGALWVVFFGLAKTFQYSAILILGKEGVSRLRRVFVSRRRA